MTDKHLERVRRICFELPGTEERLSHGEPTFFAGGKRVFVMYADNHHEDGRLAVWLPAPPGMQEMLVESQPETFFRPPYVGYRGWIGVALDQIDEADLRYYIRNGWQLVAPKTLQKQFNPGN